MSYFDSCYLKRMNKDGYNRQDRIKTRKEHEFDRIFLKDSEYRAQIYEINKQDTDIICSLQPNKWNESNLISNLLMSTKEKPLQTGDILKIKMIIKDKIYDKIWLVLFVEENITKGYQLFKVICLDEEVNITDEYGMTLHTIPVKFINASATFVVDTFNFKGVGYREPNANRGFVTHDFDFLKKGTYFEQKDRGWEFTGKDNLSIPRVCYTFIGEKLKVEEEPISSKDIPVGEDENFFLIGR